MQAHKHLTGTLLVVNLLFTGLLLPFPAFAQNPLAKKAEAFLKRYQNIDLLSQAQKGLFLKQSIALKNILERQIKKSDRLLSKAEASTALQEHKLKLLQEQKDNTRTRGSSHLISLIIRQTRVLQKSQERLEQLRSNRQQYVQALEKANNVYWGLGGAKPQFALGRRFMSEELPQYGGDWRVDRSQEGSLIFATSYQNPTTRFMHGISKHFDLATFKELSDSPLSFIDQIGSSITNILPNGNDYLFAIESYLKPGTFEVAPALMAPNGERVLFLNQLAEMNHRITRAEMDSEQNLYVCSVSRNPENPKDYRSFISRHSAAGEIEWMRPIVPSEPDNEGKGISCIDLLLGREGLYIRTSSNVRDSEIQSILAKFDFSGKELWRKESSHDLGHISLKKDTDQELLVVPSARWDRSGVSIEVLKETGERQCQSQTLLDKMLTELGRPDIYGNNFYAAVSSVEDDNNGGSLQFMSIFSMAVDTCTYQRGGAINMGKIDQRNIAASKDRIFLFGNGDWSSYRSPNHFDYKKLVVQEVLLKSE